LQSILFVERTSYHITVECRFRKIGPGISFNDLLCTQLQIKGSE